MVPVGVRHCAVAGDVAHVHLSQEQLPVVEHTKAVTSASVGENGPARRLSRRLQWITPPDPGLNREILKLQIRRVANDNAVSSAVEFKRLADHSRNKGSVSLQIAAVPT